MKTASLLAIPRIDPVLASDFARKTGRRFTLVTLIAAVLLVAPLVGIWQKNRVEGTFQHNNRLRDEIALAQDAIAREEIAIRQLSRFERIEPLAASRLGLIATGPASKVYVPIAPPPAAEPERYERSIDFVVAAARDGFDWLLPGNDARAGDSR